MRAGVRLLALGLFFLAGWILYTRQVTDSTLAPFHAQVTLTVAALQAQGTEAFLDQQMNGTMQAERETQQALDLQFAQATLFAAQTQDVVQATQAADQATATAGAADLAQRQTATAQVQATQAVWPLTATPLAATQNAVVRADRESELQAYWNTYVIPAQVILPTTLFFIGMMLIILAAVLLYPRLTTTLEALEMRLRTTRDAFGEETIVVHSRQDVRLLRPGRAQGHALRNTPTGVLVDRTPDGPQWQAGVTANEQMIRLAQVMKQSPLSPTQIAQHLLHPLRASTAALPEGTSMDAASVTILPPEHPEIQEILTDVEPRLLEKLGDGV